MINCLFFFFLFLYTVFVLQSPAYLPVYLALEAYGRASAEFSITLLLVNLPASYRFLRCGRFPIVQTGAWRLWKIYVPVIRT